MVGFNKMLHISIRHFKNYTFDPRHEICNNVVCATSKASDQTAHMRSLIRDFANRLNINLLTEHHLEFLSLTGGCIGPSEYATFLEITF